MTAIKVIIDTNVLISAILKNKDPEKIILHIIQSKNMRWLASQQILKEYSDVLKRPKFNLPPDLVKRWELLFEEEIEKIKVPNHLISFDRDPKDSKFLNCALLSNAHFLVTGDHDFKEAYKIVSTTILNVSKFKNVFKI